MAPENGNCSLMSYLEYWQSSSDNLEMTANRNGDDKWLLTYLDHFLYCSRNPGTVISGTELKLGCMPRWGGLVDPAVALGGFMQPGRRLKVAYKSTYSLCLE